MKPYLFAALLLVAPIAFAETVGPVTLGDTLRKATVAVYVGKQVCEFKTVPGLFGEPESEWTCEFKNRFVCTGTVIQSRTPEYVGLTAGHCFNWKLKDEYYISESVGEHPVLRKIRLLKFENDNRYDYAIFSFESFNVYPAMPVETKSISPALGTEIINANFAYGLVKQTTHGLLVSELITSPADGDKSLQGRYLVSIGLGPGASGSAVVDIQTGMIIGVVEAIFPETQMPTVVMPTGQSLMRFMEDDSAGIQPEHEPAPKVDPVKPLSVWDKVLRFFHAWYDYESLLLR